MIDVHNNRLPIGQYPKRVEFNGMTLKLKRLVWRVRQLDQRKTARREKEVIDEST
jgi:hypothetical protein